MNKRVFSFFAVVALLLYALSAYAGGFFPSSDELFGTQMPSIEEALNRLSDETVETDEGSQEVYNTFSNDDYWAFSKYLSKQGAKLSEYTADNYVLKATLSANKATMYFEYDWENGKAVATYPEGTRPAKVVIKDGDTSGQGNRATASGILPPVGGIMPSAQFAIDKKPSSTDTTLDGTTQVYKSFSDADYDNLSAYLYSTGAKLESSETNAGIMKAEIALNSYKFSVSYDWNGNELTVLYPTGTTVETKKWNVLSGKGALLPSLDQIGSELPSLSQAIARLPDSEGKDDDGGIFELYNDFTASDYNAFSQYLMDSGCAVDEYYTAADGTLVIKLSNMTGKMTFEYDAARHTGKVTYPENSRIEVRWVPTPVPTAAPSPEPTPIVIHANYNEEECWQIAVNYLKSLYWKNTQPLKIDSHTTKVVQLDESAGYTFLINYQVPNNFGVYVRSIYMITVDMVTGEIFFATYVG